MVATRKLASAAPTPASALAQLQQEHELKIIAITEPLRPKDIPQSSNKRNSAASVDSDQHGDTHPAALEEDLKHYKVSVNCGCRRRKADAHIRSFLVSYASPM
jgi:TusA-related sulfurtransferase